ncbi:MAG: serine/threonine protein phosphatase [Planctomycetaceae bacterium]|nr:serine/threonine protein phosphatase [Planctomycetaceae bacterium]
MQWEQPIQYASISDIGFRRRNNQDSCVVYIADEETWTNRGHLFIVADGMGGHAVGELASKMAVDTIPQSFLKSKEEEIGDALGSSIQEANTAIHKRGSMNKDFNRMGTTVVSLVLCPEGAISGHVGDSRLYRIRDQRIEQITFDHSLQWELARQGRLKLDEAFLQQSRHVITRSLGPEGTVDVDIEGPLDVEPGDTFLACTDGLTGHVNDQEIGIIARELPVGDACRLLVNLANLRGGSDNITVVIARAGAVPPALSDLDKPKMPWTRKLWWFAFLLTLVGMGVGGALIGLMRDRLFVEGIATSTVCGLIWVLLLFFRLKPKKVPEEDVADTKPPWKPYRTASAKLTRKFLNDLAELESKLQKTGNEEGWSIDWSAHEEAFKACQETLENKQYSKAVAAYAKALDILMAGVQRYRKQLDRQAKWGKNDEQDQQQQ